MSQVEKALGETEFLNQILDTQITSLWNTTCRGKLLEIKRDFENDRTINSFIKKARLSGREALASELAIRARIKVNEYMKRVQAATQIQQGRATQMGFFWNSKSDIEMGTDLLRAYYDTARNYVEFSFLSFEEFLNDADSKIGMFAELVGELVSGNKYSTSEGQAKKRLQDLAMKSKGQASYSQIVAAAGGSGSSVNWTGMAPDLLSEVGTNVVDYATDTLTDVGTGVKSTIRLVKYLPWILGGVAVIYIISFARNNSGAISKFIERKLDKL